jgi:hypothetical protein
MYVRLPCNEDGSTMSYAQRKAQRQRQDAERRAAQNGEPTGRDPFFDLPLNERRRIRQAEEQGRREAQQLAAIEEQAKRQFDYDATPEHERRPRNTWRDLIEMRKPDAWRKDVAQRIKLYEKEARAEDERIDALMAEKQKRQELESAPEYARALAHWDRVSMDADADEAIELARLKGVIEGGGANRYWQEVHPLTETRLEKARAAVVENARRQARTAVDAVALTAKQKAIEELQVPQEEPTDTHPLVEQVYGQTN